MKKHYQRPKVLLVSQLPIIGGEQLHILEIINRLSDKYDFTVALGAEGGFTQLLEKREIKFLVMKMAGHLNIRAFGKAVKILRKRKYDIIHLHSPRAAYYFILGDLFAGRTNFIWTHHIFIGDAFCPRTLKGRLYLWGARLLHHRVALNLAVSNYVEEMYRKSRCGTRFKTIYNGVELSAENVPKKISTPIRLGIVSRLEEFKGYPLLIEMIRKYEMSEFEFHIFNDGRMSPEIKQLAKEYFSVKYWGFVEDKDAMYEKFDVLLLLSRFEGFGYVTIEAVVRGIPVIAYNTPLNRELLSNYPEEGYFKQYSSDSLKKSLDQLKSSELYQTLLSALEKIDLNRFDIDNNIHLLEDVYEEILNEDRN
ncbi:glycosyltransferase family 4 protein [bacterium]|nr:glycosyltransferase family 4 protein [bacterium]